MYVTILLPHYKTAKITAYSVYKLLQNKGKHEVDIIVIDNNAGDGTIESLKPFENEITILSYPKDKMQSHGVSFDWAMPNVKSKWFITVESDSFPITDTWLDYYETLISQGVECAGSVMKLASGTFLHPCGALYKKSIWEEANKYYQNIEYSYFPSSYYADGFDYHLMIHDKYLTLWLESTDKEKMLAKKEYYKPLCGVFHNSFGNNPEYIYNYMNRDIQSEVPNAILDNNYYMIKRVGFEPGQAFCYWMIAMGVKVVSIPTQTLWMPNKVNIQQERTIMANGYIHLWGGSSFLNDTNNEIAIYKNKIVDELYDSMPEEFKTPLNQ